LNALRRVSAGPARLTDTASRIPWVRCRTDDAARQVQCAQIHSPAHIGGFSVN
jgi:hypothetical protein